jgi:hypothetical protein
MRATYVYGVVRDGALSSADGVDGLGGAPTRAVAAPGVAAIVSSVDETPVQATRSNLTAHNDVVEAVAAGATVLPMRFGFVMRDDNAVARDLLRSRRDEFLSELARFDSHVELALTVYYDEDALLQEVVRGEPAIARMRDATQRLTAEAGYYQRIRLGEMVFDAVARKRRHEADTIRSELERVASAADSSEGDLPDRVLFKSAFLVERGRVPEFEAAVEELAEREAERLQFKLVGPVPPYSFVKLGSNQPAAVPWA